MPIPSTVAVGRQSPSHTRRILLAITSSDYGGAEIVLEQLASALPKRGFDVTVCSLRPLGRMGNRLAATGLPVVSLEMSSAARPHEILVACMRLARAIDSFEIDLVQSFLYRANLVAAIGSRLAKHRPLVLSGQHSRPSDRNLATRLAARLTRPLVHRMVAVSSAVRSELLQHEGIPDHEIVVIRNGVDTQKYPGHGVRSISESPKVTCHREVSWKNDSST